METENLNKEIAFLFGAGISIPAKIPFANYISEIILGTKDHKSKKLLKDRNLIRDLGAIGTKIKELLKLTTELKIFLGMI